MATEVKLPRLGQGMESGTIVRWLKSEGDAVEKGEPLYELDTDKVTQEVEAEADGRPAQDRRRRRARSTSATTVGVIGAQDEDVAGAARGVARWKRRRARAQPSDLMSRRRRLTDAE